MAEKYEVQYQEAVKTVYIKIYYSYQILKWVFNQCFIRLDVIKSIL